MQINIRITWLLSMVLAVCLSTVNRASASQVPALGIKNLAATFELTPDVLAKDYSVQEIACSSPANIFWPTDKPSLTLEISNNTDGALQAVGKLEVISFGVSTNPADAFDLASYSKGVVASMPLTINLPAKGFVDTTIAPPIPAKFGGYALVVDMPGHGRDFAATVIRCLPAQPGPVQFPAYTLDAGYIFGTPLPDVKVMAEYLQRLGVKGTRAEIGYDPTTDSDYNDKLKKFADSLKIMQDHDVAVMLTSESEQDPKIQPLSVIPRGWLDDSNTMVRTYPGDLAWLPSFDDDYQLWIKNLTGKYGWPKGPINAVELWNEPWQGLSISGWGADILRYREIYAHMAEGIEQARAEDGVEVLIGGACSSMNTEDNLFPDGKDTFLKWLDFTSIHYQPLGETPVLYPKWVHRDSPNGGVRVWDTESWSANSEDRVSAVVASSRAQGLDRVSGVNHATARDFESFVARGDASKTSQLLVQPMPVSAAIAACQNFMGQRKFNRLLFQNGLPWVFVFDGLTGPDDGTAVVVGDLGGIFNPNSVLYKDVHGFSTIKAAPQIAALQAQLAALPSSAPADQATTLNTQIKALQLLHDASMRLDDAHGAFGLYDYFGNKLQAEHGTVVVPLNQYGYFLRPSGAPGSFAKMIKALLSAKIEGYEPVDIIARDLTAPIESHPSLQLKVTNILNRQVTGSLSVKLSGLTLDPATQTVTLAPNESRDIAIRVSDGQSISENTYVLDASFDGGADGVATHSEAMHVDTIAHKTITVDGNLDDWQGVIPVPMRSDSASVDNTTLKAWFPFEKFDDATGTGYAQIYLARDDDNLYFAARIAEIAPSDGGLRFAARDDDSYFYPDVSYPPAKDGNGNPTTPTPLTWPAAVRHYTYRKSMDLPADSPDNVQIAFNVVPDDQKGWYTSPPGTPPNFMVTKTTDYEYALNQVAPKYGGGTEMWRLLAPGVPYKNFFPREPQAPIDGGPVKNAQLVMKDAGGFRIVEAAIPWSEIPDVKARIDAGQTIKFNCRVNGTQGSGYELAAGRSASKQTIYALHDLWASCWATEVEYGAVP